MNGSWFSGENTFIKDNSMVWNMERQSYEHVAVGSTGEVWTGEGFLEEVALWG
jgi:hypothetical protein